VVALQDGAEVAMEIRNVGDFPHLVNPDILLGENDLTKLSYLHEPAVLHNLKTRFTDLQQIYTYCGIVLVAINPYQSVPIYSREMMSAYHQLDTSEADPHLFAIAEEALRRIARTQSNRKPSNQSVIISGESGAGKTVSAKYILRYFAFVSGSDSDVERKVLASNPVMESIGNAKTTRNDNSSRFGKYLQIHFDRSQTIIGASLRTYLLEKTRVVSHAVSERNYHIFYQLCSAYVNRKKAGSMSLDNLKLGSPCEFHYLNQGQAMTIEGVDDNRDFLAMHEAMGMLGISDHQKTDIFTVLAAILHLGNIQLIENDGESCDIDSHDHHLITASSLLGISQTYLQKWLCNKLIVMDSESITTPLKLSQTLAARDGLAKHLYAQLFDWIVEAVNGRLSSGSEPDSFIGVLDIYGFEVFKVNSFEQFCINYANEKLQQQFNLHVFKLEQEEYVREGIDWSAISFHDNQPCIDLIEGKYGLLDQIDETCKLPGGCDEMLVQKFYQTHISKKPGKLGVDQFFGKPRTSTDQFMIYHFADKVTYDVWGFVEKNMDRLIPEHLTMLKSSSSVFVSDLFKSVQSASEGAKQKKGFLGRRLGGGGGPRGGKGAGRASVGAQFKESLSQLMSTLSSTIPHYIRCIKPNDRKEAFQFDPHRAVQQLRACGVLETIKISSMGYPSRWTYDDFFHRYRLLLPWGQLRLGETKAMSVRILRMFVSEEDKYCFGKTKIFFRAGEVAYLEKLRSDKLHNSSVVIQKHVKRWIQRRKYLKFRSTVIALQSHMRGCLARRAVETMRKTRASVVIQKWFRCHHARLRYKRLRESIILLQRLARGSLARRKYQGAFLDRKASLIQSVVRGWLVRKEYRLSLKRIVRVQCCVRKWMAKRVLRKLKLEAHSVDHMKQLNKGLENKIIELQQKIIEKDKLKDLLQSTRLEAQSWRLRAAESEQALKETLEELQLNNQIVGKLTSELKSLRSELAEERQSYGYEREMFQEEIRLLKEKVLDLEASQQPIAGNERNERRLNEEETSGTSPSFMGDEDGYYSSRHSETEVGDLQHEIQELRQKHQKLINDYISLQGGTSEEGVSFRSTTPTSPVLIEALQSEVTRLMDENLTLREQVEESSAPIASIPKTRRSVRGLKRTQEDPKFLGMFSFQPEDLSVVLSNLILEAKPGQGGNPGETPCLPAHIIFMCIRYVDHWNNQDLMEDFMEGVINNIQLVTRKHAKDLDYLSFWLANTYRLCQNMIQFSGQGGRAGNSQRMAQLQKEFGLFNFELAEFRHILEQKATALYLEVARSIVLRVESLVVPALLEDNPLPGMPNVPTSSQKRSSRLFASELALEDATLETFIDKLSEIVNVLQVNCVDTMLVNLLMSHVFQMINAHMLNSLLLRKDVCHWTKGIQISYTISQLEDWCHESNLGNQVADQLLAVKEATKLLQLQQTTKKDADAVVDLCAHLTSVQVQKLLTMYTPGDFEGKVPTSLIRLIGEKCLKRDGNSGRELLVHIEDSPPTKLPYTPTDVNYKKMSLPSHFNLDKLLIRI
jgi:myosin-5